MHYACPSPTTSTPHPDQIPAQLHPTPPSGTSLIHSTITVVVLLITFDLVDFVIFVVGKVRNVITILPPFCTVADLFRATTNAVLLRTIRRLQMVVDRTIAIVVPAITDLLAGRESPLTCTPALIGATYLLT